MNQDVSIKYVCQMFVKKNSEDQYDRQVFKSFLWKKKSQLVQQNWEGLIGLMYTFDNER